MSQNPNRTRQHEQTARKLRSEAQLTVDDGSRAVDIHGQRLALELRQGALYRPPGYQKLPLNMPLVPTLLDQCLQAARSGVDGMKAMPETRHESTGIQHRFDLCKRRLVSRRPRSNPIADALIKFEARLACATMHIAQYVDCRSHGAIDTNTAGAGHARNRNRRRMGTVVDPGDHGRLQQCALLRRR